MLIDQDAREHAMDETKVAASIGKTYWRLYQQPRDAWTFELDIRPFRETWQ